MRFNGPNDVVVKSDGTIWFTDPVDTSINPQKQPWPAVYRFDPLVQEIRPVATNFTAAANYPNGLCFSPDESMLYIADFLGRKILLYDVQSGETLTNSRILAQNIGSGYPQCPDGIRCDRTGRVYSTLANAGRASGLRVYSPGSQLLTTLLTPESPANLCFGGADGEMLLITASTSIYAITHMPDLAVTGICPVPANPVAGQRVTFRAVVKNQGTGSVPAGTGIQVAFSLGSLTNLIWSGSFTGGLPAGSSIVVACVADAIGSQWPASQGSHAVFATVDVDCHVTESLEQNNVFRTTLNVVPLSPDTDGDGMSDANEGTAGTDPADPNSVLRILSAQALSGDRWVLTWSSVLGKSYRIARQTNLDDLQCATSSDLVMATSSTCSWTNLSGFGNGPAFFRIVVTP